MDILKIRDGLMEGWQWRTKDGVWLDPAKMATSHLFYTLRMIWNNTMPAVARVGEVKLYVFGPTYTNEYLKRAVRQLAAELGTRADIEAEHRRQLEAMLRWLETGQIQGASHELSLIERGGKKGA